MQRWGTCSERITDQATVIVTHLAISLGRTHLRQRMQMDLVYIPRATGPHGFGSRVVERRITRRGLPGTEEICTDPSAVQRFS